MVQRVPYSLFPNSQHPGSQWHSDYYTDFSWQSFLTIPMAQRLLHRLLLAIFFDNPNGTATVTQTSFSNFFWQSQWHSDCYTDFFWQSAELRFSYQVCGKGRPSDQTWRPRLVSMKKTCAGNSHATLSPQFFHFHSRSKNPATANIYRSFSAKNQKHILLLLPTAHMGLTKRAVSYEYTLEKDQRTAAVPIGCWYRSKKLNPLQLW